MRAEELIVAYKTGIVKLGDVVTIEGRFGEIFKSGFNYDVARKGWDDDSVEYLKNRGESDKRENYLCVFVIRPACTDESQFAMDNFGGVLLVPPGDYFRLCLTTTPCIATEFIFYDYVYLTGEVMYTSLCEEFGLPVGIGNLRSFVKPYEYHDVNSTEHASLGSDEPQFGLMKDGRTVQLQEWKVTDFKGKHWEQWEYTKEYDDTMACTGVILEKFSGPVPYRDKDDPEVVNRDEVRHPDIDTVMVDFEQGRLKHGDVVTMEGWFYLEKTMTTRPVGMLRTRLEVEVGFWDKERSIYVQANYDDLLKNIDWQPKGWRHKNQFYCVIRGTLCEAGKVTDGVKYSPKEKEDYEIVFEVKDWTTMPLGLKDITEFTVVKYPLGQRWHSRLGKPGHEFIANLGFEYDTIDKQEDAKREYFEQYPERREKDVLFVFDQMDVYP